VEGKPQTTTSAGYYHSSHKGGIAQKEPLIEDIEAASAAVQNMLLAAEELGLGTVWRTGDTAYDPQVKRWLGLTPKITSLHLSM